ALNLLHDGTVNGQNKVTAISDNNGALTFTAGKAPTNGAHDKMVDSVVTVLLKAKAAPPVAPAAGKRAPAVGAVAVLPVVPAAGGPGEPAAGQPPSAPSAGDPRPPFRGFQPPMQPLFTSAVLRLWGRTTHETGDEADSFIQASSLFNAPQ